MYFYNGKSQLCAKLERLVFLWSRFWLFKSCPILFNPNPTYFLCFHILSALVSQLHCSEKVAGFYFGWLYLYKMVSCTMTFFSELYFPKKLLALLFSIVLVRIILVAVCHCSSFMFVVRKHLGLSPFSHRWPFKSFLGFCYWEECSYEYSYTFLLNIWGGARNRMV